MSREARMALLAEFLGTFERQKVEMFRTAVLVRKFLLQNMEEMKVQLFDAYPIGSCRIHVWYVYLNLP